MISTDNISLKFGSRTLFKEVSLKFTAGNCYGIIGANGSGKSSFLKILANDLPQSSGSISIDKNKRLKILKQNHFEFDENTVIETVLQGHDKLYSIIKAKEFFYAKEDFNEKDGIELSKLEEEFGELNGWDAEIDAEKLLRNLDIPTEAHELKMKELPGSDKVKVLLAQALFHSPDILIMDEPTNNLDVKTKLWLENFLSTYENTIILVSHDRHFLDNVCTHIINLDHSVMTIHSGNYTFWTKVNEITIEQMKNQNKRIEEKREELTQFIQRFSANASKSKQATSRKNLLEKLVVEDFTPSSRRYPHIVFKPSKALGDKVLTITNLEKSQEGNLLFKDFSLTVENGDKIAFIGDKLSISALFNILAGEDTPDKGTFTWGVTTTQTYFPKDNAKYFEKDLTLIDWLRQYAPSDQQDENFMRSFLGKMLFSGDETLKKCNVLSGGEKVRCMFSKMMLSGANVLILDEPTNHLDIESITSVNNGLIKASGAILFSSQDFEFKNTTANRIVEITPKGFIDRVMTYEEYIYDAKVKKIQKTIK
ncbi:MAG: ATP-binding cassette domain-containing protein [Bacteroidetes bacterium]|nr:ATP-binding cassette domain-containing protein [Bacteroidota bacterium]